MKGKYQAGSAYSLSVGSKAAGVCFKKANQYASKVYQIIIRNEPRFAKRDAYGRLLKFLLAIYYSSVESKAEQLLCLGNLSLLKQWNFNFGNNWCQSFGLSMHGNASIERQELKVEIDVGSPFFNSQFSMMKGLELRFYIVMIDECCGEVICRQTQSLNLDLDQSKVAARAVAQFSNVEQGIVLVFAAYQCRMLKKNLKDVALTLDKRFYRGEVIFTAGFYDKKIVDYQTPPPGVMPVAAPKGDIAWKIEG